MERPWGKFVGSLHQRFLSPHLVFVWILHEDTLLHYVGDDSVPSQRSHMCSHHCKHFSDESVQKTADSTFLKDNAQENQTIGLCK